MPKEKRREEPFIDDQRDATLNFHDHYELSEEFTDEICDALFRHGPKTELGVVELCIGSRAESDPQQAAAEFRAICGRYRPEKVSARPWNSVIDETREQNWLDRPRGVNRYRGVAPTRTITGCNRWIAARMFRNYQSRSCFEPR